MSKIDEIKERVEYHFNKVATFHIAEICELYIEQLRPYVDIQSDITDWAEKTFKSQNAMSKFNHLEKEVLELRNAIENADLDNIREEIADCMILLFNLAGYYQINAIESVLKKHEINKKRTWGEPDEFGVCEHIREQDGEIKKPTLKNPILLDGIRISELLYFAQNNWFMIPDWVKNSYEKGNIIFADNYISLRNSKGIIRGNKEDVLMKGIDGELYVCEVEYEHTFTVMNTGNSQEQSK